MINVNLFESGIIHRDIKPENVFLKTNRALLGDFGFCKTLKHSSELTSGAFGSPMYMAPEVIQGMPYGIASDLYSLGIVLYEMLMGKVPYDATNIEDLIKQILQQGPQFGERKLSKNLESLILSLLEPNPLSRLSHSSLFQVILNDPNYPQNLSVCIPQTNLLQQTPTHSSFLASILLDRSKSTYLIDTAAKSAHYSE